MAKHDVHLLRAVPGESTDPSEPQRITPATEEKQTEANTALTQLLGTVPIDLITTAVQVTADGAVLTPSSGKKLRIYSLKTSVDADTFTKISFSGSGASGVLETYFNPKTGGLYGGSRGNNYTELNINESLNIDITGSGTCVVNIRYIEV